MIDAVPMLAALVEGRRSNAIDLRGRVTIEVHTCSHRTTRGYSYAAVIADERAFWRDEASAAPDVEVLNAVRPGLATLPEVTPRRHLLALQSPGRAPDGLQAALRQGRRPRTRPPLRMKSSRSSTRSRMAFDTRTCRSSPRPHSA